MMKRDRHVRGVASGLALVGPIYLDEARLGNTAIPELVCWYGFRNCGAGAIPATYTPQPDRSRAEGPARIHGPRFGRGRLRAPSGYTGVRSLTLVWSCEHISTRSKQPKGELCTDFEVQ